MNYVITNGDIYKRNEIIENGILIIKNNKIDKILSQPQSPYQIEIGDNFERIDAKGSVIIPGFIDLHVHGGGGADITDATPEDISQIARFHLSNGTTGMLMTTMSGCREDELEDQVKNVSSAMEHSDSIIGIHLEGPFLNPDYCGMYPPGSFRKPTEAEIQKLAGISFNNIRMITIAPELEGALDIISYCVQNGIVASIGHSNADYELVSKAVTLGASHVTHIFNAMPQLHHRTPGVLGAALMDDRLSVQIICDGIHLHPLIVKMTARLKSTHNICVVTDAMRAAGMPNGEYMLGKFEKVTYKDGCVRGEGGALASTALTMLESFKNILAFGDLSFTQAINTVSATPAKVIGLGDYIGAIEEGYDADILILDRDLNIQKVFLKGNLAV